MLGDHCKQEVCEHSMEIDLQEHPFDIDFHPFCPLVATALINGDLHLYKYSSELQPTRLLKIHAHKKSCRAVRFVNTGKLLLTASPDFSILATDVETGAPIARLENAHEAAVNRLVNLTESLIASGDDEGCIKVWDTRQQTCCNSFDAHEEYISDMTFVLESLQLLSTSGDGTLSVSNLRKNKVQSRSEFSEDELLSAVTMKNGRKLICGTQTGALLLYSWGFFKDCSDRFLGHPISVDTLLKLDEDTLISGSGDGIIRLVGILPNKIIAPIAEHSDYPIEGLAFSHDKKFLGSISHDQMLKLWDLQELLENHQSNSIVTSDGSDVEMDIDVESSKPSKDAGRKERRKQGKGQPTTSGFFADL